MKNKKTTLPFLHMGAPSLLMIFLVLCLVTFALLSLSSAKNNLALSQESADRMQMYYKTSSQAEQVLDQIDTILAESYDASGLKTAVYQEEVTKNLAHFSADGVSDVTVTFSEKESTLCFQIPVDDRQQLSVILSLPAPSDCKDGFYRIRQWVVEDTDSWNGDDTMSLLSPVTE